MGGASRRLRWSSPVGAASPRRRRRASIIGALALLASTIGPDAAAATDDLVDDTLCETVHEVSDGVEQIDGATTLDGAVDDVAEVVCGPRNQAPIADAGPDRQDPVDGHVVLDGTASSDPEGESLTYRWVLEGPAASEAALDDATSAQPTFRPDVPGDYAATLVVGDGELESEPDTVQVAVLPRISVAGLDLATFSSASLRLSLGVPAGPEGAELTLSSDDPSVLSPPSTATVPAGATTVDVPVRTGSTTGDATITVTAPGFWAGSGLATVAARSMGLVLDPLVGVGRTNPATLVLAAPAPPGGVTASLTSSDPSIVTIDPATVEIAEGETVADLSVTGQSEGSAVLTASAAGYGDATTIAGSTATTLSVGEIPPMAPGQNVSLPISLSEPAPEGGTTVLLESADPAIATVVESVTIAQGSLTPSSNPQVTGQAIGSTVITARAEGFAPDSRTAVVQLDMAISPSPIRTNEGWERTVSITLSGAAPDAGLTVTLTSSDSDVFTVPASVVVPQGQTSTSFTLTGVGAGSASLEAAAAGVATTTAAVTVDPPPDITTYDVVVGDELQTYTYVRLTATPPQPTDITLTVASDSAVLLSTSATAVGTKSITFTGVTDTSWRAYYIHGLEEGATTTVTTQAAGFNDRTTTVTVNPSGFHLASGDFSTTTFAANTNLALYAYVLDANDRLYAPQELRTGHDPVDIAVTSSDPSVGTITTSPVTFTPAGGYYRNTHFDPATAGTTTIAITHPAGFTTPANGRTTLTATVTD